MGSVINVRNQYRELESTAKIKIHGYIPTSISAGILQGPNQTTYLLVKVTPMEEILKTK